MSEQLTLINVRPKKARYPLDVFTLGNDAGDHVAAFVSKGHHPVDKFLSAVHEHDDVDYCCVEELKPERVRHLYYRVGRDFYEDRIIYVETKPGRGAFPATEIGAFG